MKEAQQIHVQTKSTKCRNEVQWRVALFKNSTHPGNKCEISFSLSFLIRYQNIHTHNHFFHSHDTTMPTIIVHNQTVYKCDLATEKRLDLATEKRLTMGTHCAVTNTCTTHQPALRCKWNVEIRIT